MTPDEELEGLKKDYILKTLSHLKALEDLQVKDFKDASVKAEVVLRQASSSKTFMKLSNFIREIK